MIYKQSQSLSLSNYLHKLYIHIYLEITGSLALLTPTLSTLFTKYSETFEYKIYTAILQSSSESGSGMNRKEKSQKILPSAQTKKAKELQM